MDTAIGNIKQPAPNTGVQKEAAPAASKPKRAINRPHVGVVDVPKISSTPMKDELVRKERENPREIIKFKPKSKSNLHFQGALSAIIGGCGLVSLLSLIRRIRY